MGRFRFSPLDGKLPFVNYLTFNRKEPVIMPITESNSNKMFGSLPSIDVDTMGHGRKDIEGTGISQVLSIPMSQADVPQSQTSVPSYTPDEPWKP